jgi:hypothetical protein
MVDVSVIKFKLGVAHLSGSVEGGSGGAVEVLLNALDVSKLVQGARI